MAIKRELHGLFWFAKISGMFHLNKEFKISIFWTVYCVIIQILSNAAFLYSEITRQMEKSDDVNSVVFLFSAGAEAGLSVLNIACCISCYFNNDNWLEVIKGFEYVDWKLGAVKVNRWNRVFNGNLISTVLLLIAATTASLSGRAIDIWIILFLWNTVTLHLTKMNTILYLAELRFIKMKQMVLQDPSKTVMCLDVYRQIIDSLSVLSDIFSYQIIIFFAITFATFTDTAFSLVMDILNHTLQADTIWGNIKISADLLQLIYTMIFIPYQSTCTTKRVQLKYILFCMCFKLFYNFFDSLMNKFIVKT